MVNKNDKIHLKKARQLQRILLTLDRDFLYYSNITTKDSLGVIVISTGNATPLHINEICRKALPKISLHFAKGTLVKVTATKITRVKNDQKDEITI